MSGGGEYRNDNHSRGGLLKVSASMGDGLSKAASLSAFHPDDEVLPFELHVLEVALGEVSRVWVEYWKCGGICSIGHNFIYCNSLTAMVR